MRRSRRIAFPILALILLAGVVAVCQAQTSHTLRATVQRGPVVRPGYPQSADIYVDGRFAMRIPASAGGLSPMQRAQIISNRLNEAFDAGMSWENMRVSQANGLWSVMIDSMLIATADLNSARAFGIQTGELASRWGRQTVVAMGGQPRMIASQLQPVTQAVAGAVQEIGVEWVTSPTKTVPLLNMATGDRMGDAMIAGTTANLNRANAVVMHESTLDRTVIRTLIPITGTSTTGTLRRATGVGIVGLPADVVPATGIQTGPEVESMINRLASEWDNSINARLSQQNLRLAGRTKVIPLYSMHTNRIIGAAHVVGATRGLEQAQMMMMMGADGMVRFSAISSKDPGEVRTTALNNVVVSALIYTPMESESSEEEMPPPSPPETESAPEGEITE